MSHPGLATIDPPSAASPQPAVAAAAAVVEPRLAPGLAQAASGGQFAAVMELTKPRITRLVTITAAVGFVMAALARQWETLDLVLSALGTVVGTALSAAGANAINQWIERSRDAVMHRTARRPLPQGRITPAAALTAGLGFSMAGVLVLLFLAGPAPALVSLVTILVYTLVYTPLKPVTPLATLIGAIPGALPPLIGWTAAAAPAGFSGEAFRQSFTAAGFGGWALFVLMVVWQVPHFLAIAWMHREDYARGGYRMLPLDDKTGHTTAAVIFIWTVTLIPVTLAPALVMPGRVGLLYVIVAGAIGVPFLVAAGRLARRRTREAAKSVFLFSIAQLPLLLVAMVADALIHAI